jgi:hypothetical protein
MYRFNGDKIYGVLNDFDLSHMMTDEPPDAEEASKKKFQCTGTLPFMALDFFIDESTVHGYRHDVESFMWVILFLMGQYWDGKSVGESGPYHQWLRMDRPTLLNLKVAIQQHLRDQEVQPALEPLMCWIEDLNHTLLLAQCQQGLARTKKADEGVVTFDIDSCGGHITLDKVQKIFDQEIGG